MSPQDTAQYGRDANEVKELSEEELVEEFRAYVGSIVYKLRKKLKLDVPLEDMESYGFAGLLDAHRLFEPDRASSFVSYAYYRIRGAIIDGCRKEGWLTRDRQKSDANVLRGINEHMETTAATSVAVPNPSSFSEAVDRIGDMVADTATIFLLEEHGELDEIVEVPPPQSERMRDKDTRIMLQAGFALLDEQEREVLVRFYFEGESMSDIADALGYSKSWVSRVNSRAIEKMRDVLLTEKYSGENRR